jgi:hypothetical protein
MNSTYPETRLSWGFNTMSVLSGTVGYRHHF